ncbi:hypothetical protein M431DRAFT_504309 [Trichoderma harzianum CBS 226.95]|uniref:Secreted protein n=1 Tax=Trichoderma harzianum CBS 226.95 TaxID=983964 RepID=A0A2T4AQQ6_TRIHA|nr:hypothetical protein M431DRAFT_504309 [Trichoderma harzianum CBS 226.95]PTB59380.1 hypothetical protein M431DRAFT_504309 [Trichoderma harzianum CBS 226.95]
MDRLGQAHRSCRCNLQLPITTLLVCLVQLPLPASPSPSFASLLRQTQISSTSYKLLHDSLCLARPKKGPLRSPSPTQSAARQFHGVQTTRTLAHQ